MHCWLVWCRGNLIAVERQTATWVCSNLLWNFNLNESSHNWLLSDVGNVLSESQIPLNTFPTMFALRTPLWSLGKCVTTIFDNYTYVTVVVLYSCFIVNWYLLDTSRVSSKASQQNYRVSTEKAVAPSFYQLNFLLLVYTRHPTELNCYIRICCYIQMYCHNAK